MNFIIKALKEIFDFFCGEWRVFWGMTITIGLIILINKVSTLASIKPATGIIFIIGITLSLVSALKRETVK